MLTDVLRKRAPLSGLARMASSTEEDSSSDEEEENETEDGDEDLIPSSPTKHSQQHND